MGCAKSLHVAQISQKIGEQSQILSDAVQHHPRRNEATTCQRKSSRNPTEASNLALKTMYDVFVSHAKRLPDTEDRAVWVADVVETHGLRPFFDRSDLLVITEKALKKAVRSSKVCVTVLDPFTFDSGWVLQENLCAANCGIPIVVLYDSDRFAWSQFEMWREMYPWVFARPEIAVSKMHRQDSVEELLKSVKAACAERSVPPVTKIVVGAGRLTQVSVAVGGSRATSSAAACETAYKGLLQRLGGSLPSLIVATCTSAHDASEVTAKLHELAPFVPMVGCTSCRGVVLNDTWLSQRQQTGTWNTEEKAFGLGLWGIRDACGTYVVRHIIERSSSRLRDAVFAEVQLACDTCDSAPSFAMLLASPGEEEVILEGMVAALGDAVPILGGSSADNAGVGRWSQFAKVGTSNLTVEQPSISKDGITIVVAWASCHVATTLTSGFRITEHKGVVTEVGVTNRNVKTIDGKTARSVYETWSKGAVTKGVEWETDMANVLSPSSFVPFGEVCGGEITRVLHPAFVHKNGDVTVFADARPGMEIAMLTAAPETLAKKISQSARQLLDLDLEMSVGDCVGALMIFCGGLVMAIDTMMPMATEQLSAVVGHKSTMGICCFGEQGMSAGRVVHGNLMFGCLMFSSRPRRIAARGVSSDNGIVSV
mmetsp:Transcript_55601/g.148300  ORF Transcript_55601/g.148300 Transcript_55601/m.148300 type:complete len:654 (-) Transcript_55601:255-2216(-)